MGTATIVEDHIELLGPPPYAIPEELDDAWVVALFNPQPNEAGFVGELMKNFPARDKTRLRKFCKEAEGTLWDLYRAHAMRWASLLNTDNAWHIGDFKTIYEAEVGLGYAKRVIITDINMRFVVTTTNLLMTFYEFKWIYGKTISDYLRSTSQSVVDKSENIIRIIESDLIERDLSVSTKDNRITTIKQVGLKDVDPRKWKLPAGCKFLACND